MGSRYESRNNTTITRAFRRFPSRKDSIIENGMKSLLENAMLAALSFHDDTHWIHKSTANSYGWCLLRDGRAVAHHTNEGRHGTGNAYQQLMAASRSVSRKGWVGILLASMDGDVPMYFAVNYEEWVLLVTEADVRENWRLFFNPLKNPVNADLPM